MLATLTIGAMAAAVLLGPGTARGAILVDSASLSAIQDAWVDQANPTTNYGSTTTLERKAGWSSTPSSSTQKFPYVDFGAANLLATVPAGAAVYRAQLALDRVSATGDSEARVGHVSAAWNEGTIVYNSAPGTAATRYGGPLGTGAGTTVLDVTTYVDSVRRTGSGTASYRLSGGGEDNGHTTVFSSREAGAGVAPELTVEWVPASRLYTPGMKGSNLVARLQEGLSGYAGTSDTMLTTRNSLVHGADASFNMENVWGSDTSRGLVKFDLSSIGVNPAWATVTSATLLLMPSDFQTMTSIPVQVRELQKAWTENATWTTYDGVNLWDLAGAAGAGDQSAVLSSTSLADSQWGMIYLDVTSSVASWLGNPALNNGWIVDAVSATQNIVSQVGTSENATIVLRPQLWIQMNVIPEPATAAVLGLAGLLGLKRRGRRA